MVSKSMKRIMQYTALASTLVFLTTCTPLHKNPKYNKFLSYFFDGVPPITQEQKEPEKLPENKPIEPTKPSMYVHEPYQKKGCTKCHKDAFKSEKSGIPALNILENLNENIESMCFKCHDNNKTVKKYVHEVAEDCTSCHSPHQSKNEYMLKQPEKELCFSCHDGSEKHISKETYELNHLMPKDDCTSCHSPHNSDIKYQMKTSLEDCTTCHAFNYSKMHDPVTEDCSSCHDSAHNAGKSKFGLMEQTPELCLMCHDTGDLEKADHDSDMIETSCTECHSPHGSEEEKLLR